MFEIQPTGYWTGDVHLHHDWSPNLAKWIGTYLGGMKDVPLYDFGCGMGSYLHALEMEGFTRLHGLEGAPPKHAHFWDIQQQDLTEPFEVTQPGNAICLEVAEHIPAGKTDVFLSNLARACSNTLILSWAVRGQGGDGHVNCLNNDEVVNLLNDHGFHVLWNDTKSVRKAVANDPLFWFKDTLMVFLR